MTARQGHSSDLFSRVLCAWFLAFVVFTGSLVPSGTMAVATPDGFVVVLCTPEGPIDVIIDAETGKPIPVSEDDGGQFGCVWAATQVASVGALDEIALAAPEAFSPSQWVDLRVQLALDRPWPSQPARGPPILS